MSVTPAALVGFLEKQAPRPLAVGEILAGFGELSRKDRQEAGRLLEAMTREGTLVKLKGDRYSLPRQVNLAIGKVTAHRDGYGFVARETGEDLFIPARYMREAMDGDRVVARVEPGWRGGKTEGRIIRVLERAHRTTVGRYEEGRHFGYVVASDPRLTHDLFIPADATLGAVSGQMVVARIEVYPTKNRNPEGSVVEILGAPDDPEVEILTIAHKYALPYRFPGEVLEAAQKIPETVQEAELVGREDLRQLPLVTIDGESAKDFDDAVAVAEEGKGGIRLWVAIADVGHYVAEGDTIDQEALERATSVYFPGRAIPMLPERLSNGICSLNPGVDRLAMVAEMLFDREGSRVDSRFYPAVMRSRARLTYTEVRDVLAGEPATVARYLPLVPQLQLMVELSDRLTAMRRRRGSLDFDLPEAEVILDLTGKPENVVRAERNLAHRLIEECMLAANEAVATFLTNKQAPLLYRVHEPPNLEKLQAFQEFIAHFNYGLVIEQPLDPRRLQQLLAQAAGKPEERMINQVLLRSMKQARYADENVG
ncbi:MAG: VacB/RNase II family 3'-5' exoribonuclease, partial [Desulfuromonadales bacterium]|nr:VacB/RNase II family 3'-5' exoribonuclease [Desulfuromonadales bacterium]